MPMKKKSESKPFELQKWYPSEAAKRGFGGLCQAVNEQGETIRLLGSAEEPLLVLADADEHPSMPDDIHITIDEAKADWPAVTTAAIFGTRFRINGKKVTRAVLFRAPKARHPAEKYLRSSSADVNRLAQQLEEVAREVRKLAQRVARSLGVDGELRTVAESFRQSADLIDRRFRELWRVSQGHLVNTPV